MSGVLSDAPYVGVPKRIYQVTEIQADQTQNDVEKKTKTHQEPYGAVSMQIGDELMLWSARAIKCIASSQTHYEEVVNELCSQPKAGVIAVLCKNY